MRQSMRRSRSKKGSCVTTHYVKREFSNNELRDNLQAVLPIANRMPATPERPAHSMQLSMPQRTPSMQRHRTPTPMPPSVPQPRTPSMQRHRTPTPMPPPVPRTPSMQRTQSTPVPLSLMMPITRPSNNLNYYNLMNQQGNTRPLISTTDVMGDANSRRSSVTPEAVRAFHERQERPPPPPQVQSVPVEPMKFYTNPLALMMPKNAKPEMVCKNQTRSSKARQLNDHFRQTFYDLLAEKGVREETRPLIVDYFMYCTAENVKKENAQIKKVLRLAPDVDLESLKKAFDTYFTLM